MPSSKEAFFKQMADAAIEMNQRTHEMLDRLRAEGERLGYDVTEQWIHDSVHLTFKLRKGEIPDEEDESRVQNSPHG